MVTMTDVARAAGVTTMTVSHILNGRPRASAETQARVLAAVAELGYEINLRARHLRAGRTDTVALIVPSFHDYFGDVADRIAVLLETTGRHLVLERTGASIETEQAALALARLQLYDGVLLSPLDLTPADLLQIQPRVPLVLLGEREMPAELDHISLANEEGARLATAHMIARGARRVAVLGGSHDTGREMATARRIGWETAHREVGLSTDPRLVVPLQTYSMSEARAATHLLLEHGPDIDAIFAVTDAAALGAMSALHDANIRIPQEVQVAGFDNLEVSSFAYPGLTTVDPNHDAVATHAVRLLERRMSGESPEAEHIVVPVTLVQRGSTR